MRILAASRKIIHILKNNYEKLRILEISCGKSHNSGTSLDETFILTNTMKYLHIY